MLPTSVRIFVCTVPPDIGNSYEPLAAQSPATLSPNCWPACLESRNRTRKSCTDRLHSYLGPVPSTAPTETLRDQVARLTSERDEYKRLYLSALEICRRLEQG